MAAMFSAVAFGTLSPWDVAPADAYTLALAQRASVTASFIAAQSALFVAAGDYSSASTVPLRILHHSLE
jgi:hypothetical protein